MRILLTGSSGFLGSALIDALDSQAKFKLLRLTLPTSRNIGNYSTAKIEVDDPFDSSALTRSLRSFNPNRILHLAALSSPKECEECPEAAHRVNVELTRSICEAANALNAHLTFVSTDLVFDGSTPPTGGFTENDKPYPRSVYARSKHSAEEVVLASNSSFAVMRSSLIFGKVRNTAKGVLAWIENTLKENGELVLFKDEFRTPIHVTDAARSLLAISEVKLNGIWHCGGSERLSRVEFGKICATLLGYKNPRIIEKSRAEIPSVPLRPEDVSLNSTKLCNRLGFNARRLSDLNRL